jgi:hypothetical protein
MERTTYFLSQNIKSFERYEGFKDHSIYYDVIERKFTPDSVIETCKALIEGICKTVLLQVDLKRGDVRDRFDVNELRGLDTTLNKLAGKGESFHVLYAQTVRVLAAYHHSCEKDLLSKLGNEFCKYIGGVRNNHGPIAHGQVAPKLSHSSKTLSDMVSRVTDVIAFHMLEVLSLIDFQRIEEPGEEQAIIESFMPKSDEELNNISDREHLVRDFNQSLDDLYPLDGKPIYSLALHTQYPEDYAIQLQEFIDNKEEEEMA